MKTLKIKKTVEIFLNYYYQGDGKYYLVNQGSRHYNNSPFANFRNNNPAMVTVLEWGNDAPKGGQLGSFVIVEFSKEFKQIADIFFANKKADAKATEDSKAERRKIIASYASKIDKIEGESRKHTEKRMSDAIGSKIDAGIFHKAVSTVRNPCTPYL